MDAVKQSGNNTSLMNIASQFNYFARRNINVSEVRGDKKRFGVGGSIVTLRLFDLAPSV